MAQSWKGPLIAGTMILGIVAILIANFQSGPRPGPGTDKPAASPGAVAEPAQGTAVSKGAREYPIGDEVIKNHIQVVAVWLDAVAMEGMSSSGGPGLIHLEADIRATEDNPNGFAKDEFVPYLKVRYSLIPAKGDTPTVTGELLPMVAWDGLHYGANIAMPRPGQYKLVYDIEPPSANGLGRHSDPATGVAPWWAPFQVTFDWQVDPVTATAGL
ncbi:iron transporter [Tundrisphaera sp. TA3]|uniref:iron transporter n=1 Tax=Tundrisphaera sp. TA3 TaxID=3435775 RepID=UPI003EC00316